MDHAPLVRRGEAASRLRRELERLAHGQRSYGQALAERLTREQLGNEVRRALVRADVVDGKDVGVVQAARRPRFRLEPAHALGALGEGRRQHLERHVAADARIAGPVDDAHAAHPEKSLDLAGTYVRAGGEGHALPHNTTSPLLPPASAAAIAVGARLA